MAVIKEEGTFEGVISDHYFGQLSNEKQTPYLELVLDSDGDVQFHKLWLTDKGLPIAIRQVRDLGFTGEDICLLFKDWEAENDDRNLSLRNVPVRFKIVQDGEYFNVKGVYPMNKPKKQRVKPADDLIAELSAKSKALAASDDIPF